MTDLFSWAEVVAFSLGGQDVKWSDLLGNICALATVWLAIRRSLWTWPVQITGCVLLFGASLSADLGGNAARQVVLAAAALYGWYMWSRGRRESREVKVRLATNRERIGLIAVLLVGTLAFAAVLNAFDASWSPLPDAYIFVGSLVATVGQGRGLVEFWLVWIAVDIVGVPLAFAGGLPVSGLVYGVFFVMCLVGLRDWLHRARLPAVAPPAVPSVP